MRVAESCWRAWLARGLSVLALGIAMPAAAARPTFAVEYRVALEPNTNEARVAIATAPVDGRLIRLTLPLDPKRYTVLKADGTLTRDGAKVTWTPPVKGGVLQYKLRVNDQRRGGGFDARMTRDWALLRGDDLVPPARAVVTPGSDASARLRFVLPPGWGIETPFARSDDGKGFVITDPERRFDRPEGWILAGDIGVRRERIGDTRVAVAAPKGQDARRNDLLAFVHALAPELKQAFGTLPPRLLLVQAGDPMWRGGLSGPRSLYLHADRPLFSENGSSTPAHELVHVVTRLRGAPKDDWIVEGLAEYYSIELPRRAGMTSDARAAKALKWMHERGASVARLHTDRSGDRVTARAVTLFAALDAEIRVASDGQRSLDDVVRKLIPQREVSRESLRDAAEAVLGRPAQALATPLLD